MKNFKKIVLTFVFLAVILIPSKIFALEFEEVNSETTLASAIDEGKNVKLTANIENISKNILIDEKITIDLNNYNISFASKKHFDLYGGNLTLIGKGTIKEVDPYFGPIVVYGSGDKTATNFTTLTVNKDVTLEGWSPIFIDYQKSAPGLAYGVTVNVYGTLNSKADSGGDTGHGIYINGTIQHKENYPVINVYKGAVIKTQGVGIYAAGYAKWNIEGATITGGLGLGIKSGIFNLKDVTIIANDEFRIEESWSNGINSTGAAIQIESNNDYAGGINITIDGGSYTSTHGYSIQHYLAGGTANNSLESLTIDGAKVISSEKDKAITAVDKDKITVTTGTFSSDVSKYVAEGYVQQQVKEEYIVAKKEVKVETPTIDTSKETVEVEEVTIGVKEDAAVNETLQEAIKADEKLAEKVKDINSVVEVTVENQEEKVVPKEAAETITKVVEEAKNEEKGEMKVASFFDITLNVKNNVTGEKLGVLTLLSKKLTFNVALPKEITKVADGYTRTYYIVRYHDGKAEILDTKLSGNVLTFETDKFSTYAIAYTDTAVKADTEVDTKTDTETKTDTVVNPSTGDNIVIYITAGIMAMAGIGYTVSNIYKRKNN